MHLSTWCWKWDGTLITMLNKRTLMELIHYGSTAYNPERIKPVKNNWGNKPLPGTCLWACPIDSAYDWKQWVEEENFESDISTFFKFKLRDTASIIKINTAKDLEQLIFLSEWKIDFETLYRDRKIDAIWLTDSGQIKTRFSTPHNLYGWDCECVCILNPKVIYETL